MTRTIRRAAVAAALIAAPMLTFAGPAFAASAAQPAVADVAAANPGHPHDWPGYRWRKPISRPTRPVASTPTSAPAPTSSPKPTAPATTPVSPAKAPTSPTTTPASPSTAPVTASDFETQVVTLTNAERAKNGCGALRIDSRLVASARAHSADMVANNFFDHTGSDGSNFVTREARAGYTTGASAENIAYGYRTPQEVVTGWMNSAGHRANILNCSSIAVGVGTAAKSDGTLYWTQNFGRI